MLRTENISSPMLISFVEAVTLIGFDLLLVQHVF